VLLVGNSVRSPGRNWCLQCSWVSWRRLLASRLGNIGHDDEFRAICGQWCEQEEGWGENVHLD
jgi:hypothetical protein